MSAHEFETHRCEGSLKARCSIRRLDCRVLPLRMAWMRTDGDWHLYMQDVDFDWNVTYMREVALIKYCPWCGEDL